VIKAASDVMRDATGTMRSYRAPATL
jgi:hypothetical protein